MINLQHWAFGKQILGGLLASSFATCRASPFPFLGADLCTCSCRSAAVPRFWLHISSDASAWPSSGSTAVSTWTQMSSPSDPSLRTTFWLHRNLSSQSNGVFWIPPSPPFPVGVHGKLCGKLQSTYLGPPEIPN